MKKITSALLAAGLALSSVSIMAMDNNKNMKMMDMKMMDPKMMDKDGDGMISRAEFMSAHEMMFNQLKNDQDMISVKDMEKMKKHMMMSGSMMGGSKMRMGGSKMPDDNPNGKNLLGISKP